MVMEMVIVLVVLVVVVLVVLVIPLVNRLDPICVCSRLV